MPLEENGTRARARREQLLEGAQRVFLREGFAATSMDTLAREVGVSKRTLYAYYPGKEEFFVDVVRRLTLENPQTQVLDFILGLNPRTAQELREALSTLARKITMTLMQPEDQAFLRAVIADAHRFPQLTELLRQTIPQRALVEISLLLTRARDNGVALRAGNMEVMTRLFLGPLLSYALLDGLLRPQQQLQLPGSEKLEEIVNLFLWAVLAENTAEV